MSVAATPIKSAAKGTRVDAKAFDWEDPFFLDDQLSEEEGAIRDAARDYCQDKLMTRVLEANRHEKFHREIMNEMGALGLLGSTPRVAAPARGYTVYGLVARESSGSTRYRSAMSVAVLARHASDLCLRRRRAAHEIPAGLTGEWVGCFGLTSQIAARSGWYADPRRHRARRLKLSGPRCVTNAPIADVLVIWAKLDGGAIRGFILERGMKAHHAEDRSSSLRAPRSGAIMMEKLVVPVETCCPTSPDWAARSVA